MTDDEVLHEGARVAGLDCGPDGCVIRWELPSDPDGGGQFIVWENPALPAYVAELLVAMVRGQRERKGLQERFITSLYHMTEPGYYGVEEAIVATPAQRIRAALVALGHEAAGEAG